MSYDLGVSSVMASGPFWRTKIISINHRWIVTNRCGRTLVLRQIGARQPPVSLAHGALCAWHWPVRAAEQMLSLCVQHPSGKRGPWSSAFSIHELGEVFLLLDTRTSVGKEPAATCCTASNTTFSSVSGNSICRRYTTSSTIDADAATTTATNTTNTDTDNANATATTGSTIVSKRRPMDKSMILRVDVTLVRATVFVRFVAEDKSTPPFRIINRMASPVFTAQLGVNGRTTRVPPRGSAAFVLDAPTLPPIVRITLPDVAPDWAATLNLSRLGEQTTFELPRPAEAKSHCQTAAGSEAMHAKAAPDAACDARHPSDLGASSLTPLNAAESAPSANVSGACALAPSASCAPGYDGDRLEGSEAAGLGVTAAQLDSSDSAAAASTSDAAPPKMCLYCLVEAEGATKVLSISDQPLLSPQVREASAATAQMGGSTTQTVSSLRVARVAYEHDYSC
eukprot:930391-Pleurochrysis_carterae.AAC.1